MENYIKRETLAELQRAGASIDYVVVGSEEGLRLQATVGDEMRILQTAQGNTRFFKTLDAVASTLVSLGIEDVRLKLGPWQPKKMDRA